MLYLQKITLISGLVRRRTKGKMQRSIIPINYRFEQLYHNLNHIIVRYCQNYIFEEKNLDRLEKFSIRKIFLYWQMNKNQIYNPILQNSVNVYQKAATNRNRLKRWGAVEIYIIHHISSSSSSSSSSSCESITTYSTVFASYWIK